MPKADPVATATLASGGKAALASRLVAATRCASLATATGAVIDYQYDTLRRLTRSEVALNGSAIYTTAYAFRDLDASRTTTQVQYRNVRSANGTMIEGKKYTYDALGNITRISQSTKPFYTLVAYEYDAQNQLVKETYYNGNGRPQATSPAPSPIPTTPPGIFSPKPARRTARQPPRRMAMGIRTGRIC